MNKFWGRNEHGSVPKFLRDNDQILALNYENLCDGEYLNRLFISDNTISGSDTNINSTTEASNNNSSSNESDNILNSSELSEDLIIYGEDIELGRLFFNMRFSKDLLNVSRNQDPITNLINRQSIVFDHIGRLMIERCRTSLTINKTTNVKQSTVNVNISNHVEHMIDVALQCTLNLFKGELKNINTEMMDNLITIVFQMCEETIIKNTIVQSKIVGHMISFDNQEILRNILYEAGQKCLNFPFIDHCNRIHNSVLMEEVFKTSLLSFYGLLSLGLHTKNLSEILVAISNLMLILLRAEEWYSLLKAENKSITAATTQITLNSSTITATTSTSIVLNNNSKEKAITKVNEKSQFSKAAAIKAKPTIDHHSKSITAATNKSSSTSKPLQQKQGEVTSKQDTIDSKHNHVAVVINNNNDNNAATTTNINNTNPSNSNTKSWENNKIVITNNVEKDQAVKSKTKGIKPDVRAMQEILDPNMFGPQELASYYATSSNVNIPNQIKVLNSSSSNSSNQQKIQNVKGTNNSKNLSLNNNNNKAFYQDTYVDSLDISPRLNQKMQYSPRDVDMKYKKDLKTLKDTLQNLLKVPKPMLKVLYDRCISISSHNNIDKDLFRSTPDHSSSIITSLTTTNTTTINSQYATTSVVHDKKVSSSVTSYVWSCGQNSYGELGVGDAALRKTFAKVLCLDDKRIIGIGAGNEHSLFVADDGKLYTAGYNDNGQCGMGSTQQVRQPTAIASLEGEDIVQVHVYNGCEHTIAITRDGRIFSFGYNYRGQLGLGSTSSESTPRPIRSLLSRKVILAACSYHHTFMLCADGALFSCGRNDFGQLGHGDTVDKKTPQAVLNCPRNTTTISCGQFHTLAATSFGVAYACGKNDYGQLGLENSIHVKVFTEITCHPEIEQVVQVCCGYYHSLLLSNTGIVAGFGRNDYGQIGLGHTIPKVQTCTVISSLRDKSVRMLSAGCYHSVVITANGMLYVFGRNNHGQLATGDQEERHSPHPVDDFVGQRIIAVAAGFYHTIVLTTANSSKNNLIPVSGMNVNKCSVTDVVETVGGVSLNVADSLNTSILLPVVSSNKDNTVANLLKDVSYLTGIELNSKFNSLMTLPFSIDRRSKVSSRDLLLFLMNHVETLGNTTIIPKNTNKISSNLNEYSNESILWIKKFLQSVIVMFEICSTIIADSSSDIKLPISYEDALTYMLKMIKILNIFLNENSECILKIIEDLKTNNYNIFKEDNMLFISDILKTNNSKQEKNRKSIDTIKLLSILIGKDISRKNDETNEEFNMTCNLSVYGAIAALREKLLTIYFSTVQKELENHMIYQSILSDIAVFIAQSNEIILPDPSLISNFFNIMRSYIIPDISESVNIYQQSLCLRILTIYSTNYCSIDEVIRLFQKSKLSTLKIFQCILSLYGHFSMHSLSRRVQNSKSSTVSNTINTDIRRLISVFENTLSNFIKCGIPIIFSLANATIESDHYDIFKLGLSIIKDTITDAINLLDYVLQQNQNHSEDMLGQLRYGTVMPSILPSILIYGISFTKYGCLMLDIIPDLKVLVKKLQLISKPSSLLNSGSISNTTPSTKLTSSKAIANNSNDKRPGVNGTTIAKQSPNILESNLTNKQATTTILPKKDEINTELSPIDDLMPNKQRDAQHITWWFRIIKLATVYIAKMSASLIYTSSIHSKEFSVMKDNNQDEVGCYEIKYLAAYRHNIWNFVSYSQNIFGSDFKLQNIKDYMLKDIEDKRANENIVSLCATYRTAEKTVDPMYKMLSQSSQSALSENLFNLIEESILDVIIKFQGYPISGYHYYINYFKLITRFTKRIHSHRSVLVSNSNELSWLEILLNISNMITLFCSILKDGEVKVSNHLPLILPSKTNKLKSYWRKAILIILCLNRWKACVCHRLKTIPEDVISFLNVVTDIATNNLTIIGTNDELSYCIYHFICAFNISTNSVMKNAIGFEHTFMLLDGLNSNSLKSDVLNIILTALKDKIENIRNLTIHNKKDLTNSLISLCCSGFHLNYFQVSCFSLYMQLSKYIFTLTEHNSLTIQEVSLLSNAIKFIQLLIKKDHSFNDNSILSFTIIKSLILKLTEKQNANNNINDDKIPAVMKKGNSLRERITMYQNSALGLLSYLQSITISLTSSLYYCKPYYCIRLLNMHNDLINSLQLKRLEDLRIEDLQNEENSLKSSNIDNKDSPKGNTSNVNQNSFNLKQQTKEGNKRRCQDLITKPMEFCRSVEGFVIQGEKLLSNYKGVDFTIVTWIMISKKPSSLYSFITGKVSHSDAWPLILLRNDGKLDILYGHNNELERFTSEGTIQQSCWTHLSIIVEQKKIKVFINGILDCQVVTSKGNGRAILFPLLVGSCPLSVRTKVTHVKEGFDGMLSQYKYYSRALSPIHIKVVYDNGPPETSDLHVQLIYQLISNMKCILTQLHPAFIVSTLEISANTMHTLFVTDTCRRTRFAALNVLVDILYMDSISDFKLSLNHNSMTTLDTCNSSIFNCKFLSEYSSFQEKVIAYFIKLAGACWAPHFLKIENHSNLISTINNNLENMNDKVDKYLEEFLQYSPGLIVEFDGQQRPNSSPQSLASNGTSASMVDKLASKVDARGEICNQILKLIGRLATSLTWNQAISSVIRKILNKYITMNIKQQSSFMRIDTIGCVLLLGGGAAGPYIGVNAKYFFGDFSGKILNINKATNYVTLLGWNSLHSHQQIIKVRLNDLNISERQDMLSLSKLEINVSISVLNALKSLNAFIPIILSDFLSVLHTQDSFQNKTLLKAMCPLEIFIYSQLLHSFSCEETSFLMKIQSEISTNISFTEVYRIIQQAAIASLKLPNEESHLNYANKTSDQLSLSNLWLKSANYIACMPNKFIEKSTLSLNEFGCLDDFIKNHINIRNETLNEIKDSSLLKQGRLHELITSLIKCNDVNIRKDCDIDLTNDLNQMKLNISVEEYCLVPDWQSTNATNQCHWPESYNIGRLTNSLMTISEIDCIDIMQFIDYLRSMIIRDSRKLMSSNTYIEQVNNKWLFNLNLWESLNLPEEYSTRLSINTIHNLLLSTTTSIIPWNKLCLELFNKDKNEVTNVLASSLKYFALSILPSKSNILSEHTSNLFEGLDLFQRLFETIINWIEFSNCHLGGEEVAINILKIILPSLSFFENDKIALQLTQLSLNLLRKLSVKAFDGYILSNDLLELAKSNNFTLLRARAQEQIHKYKTHNLGDISPLACNLTQLVVGLELIQRQGQSNHTQDLIIKDITTNPSTPSNNNMKKTTIVYTPSNTTITAKTPNTSSSKYISNQQLTSRVSLIETSAPNITNVRAASVDADLTPCAQSVEQYILQNKQLHQDSEIDSNTCLNITDTNIMIEVALATFNGKINSNDCYFEIVYCGTSLRFVQSGLIPDCSYYIKCRAYYKSNPLNWSPVVEFHTQKGILFTFDSMKSGPDISLSEDCLTASYVNDDTWSTILGTRSFSSGVTQWDIRINSSSTAYVFIGVATSGADLSSFLGGCSQGWGFIGEQALYHNREKLKVYGEGFSSGDIVGVTLDFNQGTLSFSKNHKNLGTAFDKIYGELYPAVAFYNVGQELEILVDGFKTNSLFESIPVSPSLLNMDDISILNELVLCLYRKYPLSHRLNVLIAEHCNNWCQATYVRYKAVSGREVFLSIESSLLKRFNLITGERVRTTFGVAEVAGSAYNKIWFKMNTSSEVWYYSIQQIIEGQAKNLFLRCSYDLINDTIEDNNIHIESNLNTPITKNNEYNISEQHYHICFDPISLNDLIDPIKWSEEMDQVLLSFLLKLSESNNENNKLNDKNHLLYKQQGGGGSCCYGIWSVTTQQVTDNFRMLQTQFSRLMLNSHELSFRWGISGPKRKAVLARLGLLRYLNQLLELYLPFLVSDSTYKAFAVNQPTSSDDFSPMIISLQLDKEIKENNLLEYNDDSLLSNVNKHSFTWPLMIFSWDDSICINNAISHEIQSGPLHAIRRRIFTPSKLIHFWEVIRKTTTRPAKTEDDYDYPEDLPHVKINRLKSFRAKEASELLKIPGEDLILTSMFCQLWRELRQNNDEKLRISYTHPMDDGQSRTFKIKFEGEGVDDYGGPYREIFQQICEELQSMDPSMKQNDSNDNNNNIETTNSESMKRPSSWMNGEEKQIATTGSTIKEEDSVKHKFDNNNNMKAAVPIRCFLPLLMPTLNWTADIDCTERYRYIFHPASKSPLKMDLYHFMGQLVGIAIRSKITLDLSFPSYLWKYVVCERLTEHDLASFDVTAYDFIQRLASLHKQYLKAKQNQITYGINNLSIEEQSNLNSLECNLHELISDLTWSYTRSDGQIFELILNKGKDSIQIDDIQKYLVLYMEARLTESQIPMGMFRKGLISIIPESALTLLNWEEIQNIVCGDRIIDIDRLKDNTEYDDDLSPDDIHIILFWDVLSNFTEIEKSAFLRFVWARPTLPPIGIEFSQKMRILTAVGDDAHLKPDQYLPKAHTCFFSINLPKYSTKELMKEKLLYAIFNCTEMDADFRTIESDIVGWDANRTTTFLPL